ncbi:MAG TPA: PhzF family phenazine biosynthesis protein [Casimicrobiaceae bacterium]|nr:PhzF family phenazine biosynthesis protein [Casimicrobiaceae bacterium]
MSSHAFRILNVFAEERLGGNPLAVFEDGSGLSAATMQALALQFNLSETTFITRSSAANARVRIFTPTFEMPFAGHPTLGTAHVVRALGLGGDALTLEMGVGIVPVTADGDRWTLEAKAPRTREVAASRAELAAMLGLAPTDLGNTPLWVDTGNEQLVIPLASGAAVRRCAPDAALLAKHSTTTDANGTRRTLAYVWARDGAEDVLCRFFFLKHGAVVEDPATGSACANLGGWLVATGVKLPQTLSLKQGEAVGRRCLLRLIVDASGRIFVSGRVIELGRGVIHL